MQKCGRLRHTPYCGTRCPTKMRSTHWPSPLSPSTTPTCPLPARTHPRAPVTLHHLRLQCYATRQSYCESYALLLPPRRTAFQLKYMYIPMDRSQLDLYALPIAAARVKFRHHVRKKKRSIKFRYHTILPPLPPAPAPAPAPSPPPASFCTYCHSSAMQHDST